MSYRKLENWQLARELVIEIHHVSLKLPKFELYEEGQQIRKSMKSVKSNIVEGYGRKRYPKDFIRFVVYALASNDETVDHLETLFETKSYKDKENYERLHKKLNRLEVKINNFLTALDRD